MKRLTVFLLLVCVVACALVSCEDFPMRSPSHTADSGTASGATDLPTEAPNQPSTQAPTQAATTARPDPNKIPNLPEDGHTKYY